MKIRIAVAVSPDGEWNSAGWGGKHEVTDHDKMQIAIEPIPSGEARYFIEVEVELPSAPPTICGAVTKV
jgi:hypothetical protein